MKNFKRPARLISVISVISLIFVISLMGSVSETYADECQTLISLHKEGFSRLQETQKAFLSAGCTEAEETHRCKKLGMALREIQGVVKMMSLRLRGLSCKERPPATPCDRLYRMLNKAKNKSRDLQRQFIAQRCQERNHTPPCRVIKGEKRRVDSLLKATQKKLKETHCKRIND